MFPFAHSALRFAYEILRFSCHSKLLHSRAGEFLDDCDEGCGERH